jgi:hypothetical protein
MNCQFRGKYLGNTLVVQWRKRAAKGVIGSFVWLGKGMMTVTIGTLNRIHFHVRDWHYTQIAAYPVSCPPST